MTDQFWDVTAPLLAEGLVDEGTIMGGPCVRAAGEFVAMPYHKDGGGIVVKLPKERVDEMIDAGDGQSFAPAGKVFKEWVLIRSDDETRLQELIRESVVFVTN